MVIRIYLIGFFFSVTASHLVRCKKMSARPTEERESTGMLDSLGLVPKTS